MPSEISTSQRVQRSIFLRTLFGGAEVAGVVERIGAMMTEVSFRPETVIYGRGEASQYLYFIVDGRVALEAPGEVTWSFGAGDGFGFLDAMRDRPHERTARAATEVHALAFSVEDWLDLVEDHAEMARGSLLSHAANVREKIAELSPDGGFPAPDSSRRSTELNEETGLVERIVLLSDAPAFERAGIQALASLAKVAQQRMLQPGEVLLAEGQRPHGVVLVGGGSLLMVRENPELEAQFGPGSLAGGLAMLGLEKSDFELRAAERSMVVSVSEEDFFDVLEDHFDLARAVFAHMSRERSELMRELARRRSSASRDASR